MMKMTTFEAITTIVTQTVVSAPCPARPDCAMKFAAVMNVVETHATQKTSTVVLRFVPLSRLWPNLRFAQMTSEGSHERVTSSLAVPCRK